ncbi:MAG: hypothetical protein PHC28_07890 [Flavobacterium sp.]|nr:hypothetical protein [Flavobacterium sp.]MDD5150393.1 hypothetical protein [Flavobacterium sp.]
MIRTLFNDLKLLVTKLQERNDYLEKRNQYLELENTILKIAIKSIDKK